VPAFASPRYEPQHLFSDFGKSWAKSMIVEHNPEKWEPAFPRQTRLRVCREEKSLPTAHHIQVFFWTMLYSNKTPMRLSLHQTG
jgi:hypothetical protein